MELSTGLQLAQLIFYAGGAILFVVMIKADVRVLKVEMTGITNNLKLLNGSFEKLGTILTQVAVQDQRLTGIEEDIREIKHGKGFIHSSLNGEWGGGK